jgi:hypothetical protein
VVWCFDSESRLFGFNRCCRWQGVRHGDCEDAPKNGVIIPLARSAMFVSGVSRDPTVDVVSCCVSAGVACPHRRRGAVPAASMVELSLCWQPICQSHWLHGDVVIEGRVQLSAPVWCLRCCHSFACSDPLAAYGAADQILAEGDCLTLRYETADCPMRRRNWGLGHVPGHMS